MFYRVTTYSFDEDRYDEALDWTETVRPKIEGIDGLLHVDTFVSDPGEAVIVAAYENEEAFTAASETVMSLMGDMAQFMTSAPHTYSGTVDQTFGR